MGWRVYFKTIKSSSPSALSCPHPCPQAHVPHALPPEGLLVLCLRGPGQPAALSRADAEAARVGAGSGPRPPGGGGGSLATDSWPSLRRWILTLLYLQSTRPVPAVAGCWQSGAPEVPDETLRAVGGGAGPTAQNLGTLRALSPGSPGIRPLVRPQDSCSTPLLFPLLEPPETSQTTCLCHICLHPSQGRLTMVGVGEPGGWARRSP